MKTTVAEAIAKFGNPSVSGEPEDQLRAPFEQLLGDMAALCGFAPGVVVAVGESSLAALNSRPDYPITVHGPLVGFVELKAPGKGADPRRMKGAHDRSKPDHPDLFPAEP